MESHRYELVIRWPSKAGDIEKLISMQSIPLARTPRQVDLHAATVWVAVDAAIVARFRSRGWTAASRLKLLDGATVEGVGPGRLQIEPGTAHLLRTPLSMSALPGGSTNPFGHRHAIRYLLPRPRRFVTITKAAKAVTEAKLPIMARQDWLQVARDQAPHTIEGVKHATEAQLVLAYSDHRRTRSGKPLIRHRLEVSGAVLWSDAFDPDKNMLIEAKSNTSRPAVRMAIGQLLDYRRAMRPKKPNLAMLLPQMPSDDLLDLAASVGIATIWRRPDGTFWDSAGGRIVG